MAAPKLSRQGLMELIAHEGIVQTRYRDSAGVWTIGVGHTRAAGAPDPRTFAGVMSIGEVFALLRRDMARYEEDVRDALKVAVSTAEFDALVSFHYNTGGIARAALTTSLNAGDRERAATAFMNWSKPAEIIPRRRKEQNLFAAGRYSGGGKANVYPADEDGNVQWSKGRSINLTDFV